MGIDEMTLGQAKELAALFSGGGGDIASPYVIGRRYIIRTVTMTLTGRLTAVTAMELVLEDAAWVADTGRWSAALSTGVLEEVEPFPSGHSVIVGRGALVDATEWQHPLPREQR